MNQKRPLSLTLWLALALAILPALRAQEAPPAQPAPAEKPAVEETTPPAPAEKAEVQDTETEKQDAPAAEIEQSDAEQPMRDLTPANPGSTKTTKRKSKRTRSSGGDTPPHFGSQTIAAGQTQGGAVSVRGDTVVDGELLGEAVSILGSTTVNGTVGDVAVSILGKTTVNGRVKGEVVAVLGDVELGPEAVVDGEVVAVLGAVKRSPTAKVGGSVQQIGGSIFEFGDFDWLRAYFVKCMLLGRPLGFGENLGWAWMVAGIFLVFYMLLALLFPSGIERCAEALEQKPGNTILAALLAALLTPIVLVLLAITGVGLVLIPFLIAGLFFGTLFGKAAVFAWFGRRVTHLFGDGLMRHAVFAVMFGGIMVALLYTIPFLGILLWKLFGILGLGMVVYVLINSMKRERPAAPIAAPAAATAGAAAAAMPAAQSAGFGAVTAGSVPPTAEPPPAFAAAAAAPMISALTLPRAGFWIRVAAAFLDFLMIAVACAVLDFFDRGPGPLFVILAGYCAVMWKLRGTTIGGIICGLKVVRLDDRPVDWGVAVVRALSAFLSLFAAGLGFIWVAFDNERQSWHDKIAGTTIVKVPKGTPLL